MIQVENTGEGRIRFATKNPTAIEVILIDGKMFVHSEPLMAKSTQTTPTSLSSTSLTSKSKIDEKELDFLKDSKTS